MCKKHPPASISILWMTVPTGVFMVYKDIMRVTNIVNRTVWDIQPYFLLFNFLDHIDHSSVTVLDDAYDAVACLDRLRNAR